MREGWRQRWYTITWSKITVLPGEEQRKSITVAHFPLAIHCKNTYMDVISIREGWRHRWYWISWSKITVLHGEEQGKSVTVTHSPLAIHYKIHMYLHGCDFHMGGVTVEVTVMYMYHQSQDHWADKGKHKRHLGNSNHIQIRKNRIRNKSACWNGWCCSEVTAVAYTVFLK